MSAWLGYIVEEEFNSLLKLKMGQTKKAKVMFTCDHKVKEELGRWANSERRTVSNLVEGVVTDALNKWKRENEEYLTEPPQ